MEFVSECLHFGGIIHPNNLVISGTPFNSAEIMHIRPGARSPPTNGGIIAVNVSRRCLCLNSSTLEKSGKCRQTLATNELVRD